MCQFNVLSVEDSNFAVVFLLRIVLTSFSVASVVRKHVVSHVRQNSTKSKMQKPWMGMMLTST